MEFIVLGLLVVASPLATYFVVRRAPAEARVSIRVSNIDELDAVVSRGIEVSGSVEISNLAELREELARGIEIGGLDRLEQITEQVSSAIYRKAEPNTDPLFFGKGGRGSKQ